VPRCCVSGSSMKELLAILQAVDRARSALAAYSKPGTHHPEVTIIELMDILESDEVTCALEKVQASVGSPPITPDVHPLERGPTELPPF
jgi:hypothetical protein